MSATKEAEREQRERADESQGTQQIELVIDGMTCASCAARVQKRLNKLEGVSASVNLATEHAAVTFDPAEVRVDDLIGAVQAAGYGASLPQPARQEGDPARVLLARLIFAIVLSVPVAVLAWVTPFDFSGWKWVSLALTAPVVLYSGWPFHDAAARSARHLEASMDTLISLGTLAAFIWSVVVLLAGLSTTVYFDAAALITALILLGRYLETRAKRRSGEAIRKLLELGAKDARVLRDGREVLVPIAQLAVGDRFVVSPGEKVATDGIVVQGSSAVDASILTGEPVPVEVTVGDELTGATINTYGRLVVRATRVGAQTALAQIARLVRDAQAGKAPVQRLADRISSVFVPIVIGLSLLTLAGWLLFGAGAAAAFTAAVAVVVIACPCALGLATPTALMVASGRGAQLGIVIKGVEVLERTRRITAVVLDKTGTVTEGRMAVEELVAAPGVERSQLLRLAGASEAASEHPIARAIAAHARAELGGLPQASGFVNRVGLGVRANVERFDVLVGRPALLEEWGLAFPERLRAETERLEADGRTVVAVGWGGHAQGLIAVRDKLKPTSAAAVAQLRALGLTPVLLTGDNERAAASIARELGIERVLAGVLPDGKAQAVAALQQRGEVVAMVGDGINDAPALAQADLGLAIGSGTDVAIEASDLTLVSGDLRAVADAIRLARRTLATIKGNLFWAFAYNLAAVPLAIAGVLNPIVAAAAMSFSSVFVVTNSLRLRRFHSRRETA